MSKILIVDDEPDILELVRNVLESENYDVTTAKSGEEALQILETQKPDLMILDVILPGITGLALLRKIRQAPIKSHMKILLFTALGSEVKLMLSKNESPDGYLSKPFSTLQLLALVNKLLLVPD